ncbi:MAG: hypothetical protein RDU25_00180 [Patescibacteria group bacterium]|nr:hypothetical protein [Patescibacteria group bacterium]
MPNYHLHYAISKRTPPSPKAWKAIADVQTEMNRRFTWSHERLALALERQPARPGLAFPFVQLTPQKPELPSDIFMRIDGGPAMRFTDSAASGSTRVRDSLWNAHLATAFLRRVSAAHPELLFELRDEGGFVLPGSVWIRDGKVGTNREWLNRERERALELSGDPQAAAPFVWAECEALRGRFFQDTVASDYAEVPEMQDLGLDYDELGGMSLEEAALRAVERLVPIRTEVLA